MEKIAILDGITAIHGGLSWDNLNALGDVTYYDRTLPEEIIPRCLGQSAVITNKVPFSSETLDSLPDLRYIGVTATGFNIIDVEAARERNIVVTNVPAYSTDSVAQQVFAFILQIACQISHYESLTKAGKWQQSSEFCLLSNPTIELKDKVLGIIGVGDIGGKVLQIAESFGMKVLKISLPGREKDGYVALDEALPEVDFLTLHCPQNEQTTKLVNKEFLSKLKPTATLINTARGGIIDEEALAAALHDKTLSHACLDVLSTEPPMPDNPLFTAPNCTITPHIAWSTDEARGRLIRIVYENFTAFLRGDPQNQVS